LTGPELTIRPASERDVPMLIELGIRTFTDTYGHANDAAELAAHAAATYDVAEVTSALRDPLVIYLVAEVGSQPAGFAKLVLESIEEGVDAASPAELNQLYVAAEQHGKGVGRALLTGCVDRAHGAGCDVLWLGVWEANPKAIAFYERFGLRRIGTHGFRLGTQLQTDVLMAMTLRP
jgi:diamine N-acetyltransferase